jgi:hypothetical protein
LFNLRDTDALNLAFTNTISVEDNSGRIGTIVLLEAFQRFNNTCLQRGGSLLANLILNNAR